MTSTEELVRNALADLAPTAPADSRAYAGVGRRITHRRRRRAATRLAAVAAVGLVAVAGAALLGGPRDEPSGFSTEPGEDVTTAPDTGQVIETSPVLRDAKDPHPRPIAGHESVDRRSASAAVCADTERQPARRTGGPRQSTRSSGNSSSTSRSPRTDWPPRPPPTRPRSRRRSRRGQESGRELVSCGVKAGVR